MIRSGFSSLRVRAVLLILFAFLPTAVLMLYTASEQRRLSTVEAQENEFRLLRPISAYYEHLIEQTHQLLIVLSAHPSVRAHDSIAANALFAQLLKVNPAYSNLGAVKPNGEYFASGLPLRNKPNATNQIWFQRALATREFSVGDYQTGQISHKASLTVAYPQLDQAGQVHAVIYASIDLHQLNLMAERMMLPKDSVFALIDSDGVIIARYPNPEQFIGKDISHTALGRAVLSQKSGVIDAVDPGTIPRTYAFMPLFGIAVTEDAYTIIGIPTAIVYSGANALLRRNIILLAIVAVLTCIVAYVGGDRLVLRKVDAMAEATNRLGKGDLSARTGLRYGPDELGQLAHHFDDMASSIQDLTHLNQSILSSAGEGICGIDPHGIAIFVNPAAAAMLDWNPDELAGQNLHDCSHHTKPDGTPYTWEECPSYLSITDEMVVRRPDEFFWRKDGTSFPVEYVSTPILENGKAKGAVIVFIDATERKKLEEHKKEFYRRTILAATEGKLLICERNEIERIAGPSICSCDIRNKEDLGVIRQIVAELAKSAGMDEPRIYDFVLCVGEAATNAIKHARGGRSSLHRVAGGLLFIVSDSGAGIAAVNLPEVALKRGYTTAVSLGMGYKAMISIADKVYLATGPGGTTVGIEMKLHSAESPPAFTTLPETW